MIELLDIANELQSIANRARIAATVAIEPPMDAAPSMPALKNVRLWLRARRLRGRYFGDAWFADPAWDMLLDLYAAEREKRAVGVSSLCLAASVAPTTALKWQQRMLDAGMLTRTPDPRDRRRSFMRLQPSVSQAMDDYVVAVGGGVVV